MRCVPKIHLQSQNSNGKLILSEKNKNIKVIGLQTQELMYLNNYPQLDLLIQLKTPQIQTGWAEANFLWGGTTNKKNEILAKFGGIWNFLLYKSPKDGGAYAPPAPPAPPPLNTEENKAIDEAFLNEVIDDIIQDPKIGNEK